MLSHKYVRFVVLGLIGLFGLGILAGLANAEVAQANSNFVVNSLADETDASIGDGICATAGSVCTLRAAIAEANLLAGADSITFAPSVTGSIFVTSNLPALTEAVSIIGPGATLLAIDGQNNNAPAGSFGLAFGTAAFNYTGPKINFVVSGLTIQNTLSGAIYIAPNAFVTADDIAVIHSGGVMGAISVYTGTLVIEDSLIANNTASSAAGGLFTDSGQVIISRTVFTNNRALIMGGAMLADGSSRVEIYDSTIYSNTIRDDLNLIIRGGGISNWGAQSHMTIVNTTIANNRAFEDESYGGGVYNGGVLTVTNSTVVGNQTRISGGGIDNHGTLLLTNVTLFDNRAQVWGGAIATHGPLHLRNVTLAGNSSEVVGGGLGALTSTVTIANSILANNGLGGDCIQSGSTFVSNGYNLIEDNSCGFTGGSDPLLSSLEDNGGPTLTLALLVGSPAIDAGDPTGCGPEIDQRGFDRHVDGDGIGGARCDLGAFEFNSAPFVPTFLLYLPFINK